MQSVTPSLAIPLPLELLHHEDRDEDLFPKICELRDSILTIRSPHDISVTDEHIKEILKSHSDISELHLYGCQNITRKAFENLSELKNLKAIVVDFSSPLRTDASFLEIVKAHKIAVSALFIKTYMTL